MIAGTRRIRSTAWLFWLGLSWGTSGSVYCQIQHEERNIQNTIDLGIAVALPGQEARLPIYVSTRTGARTSRIAMEAVFPSPQLTFLNIEPGFLAEDAHLQVRAQQAGSVIKVDLIAPEKGTVPSGLIAFLIFRVAEDLEKEVHLQIPVPKVSMIDPQGRPLQVAEGSEGIINMISEEMLSLFTCFFYMH